MYCNREDEFFTDTEIASMLGMNPTSVRRWRVKNKREGAIKYGPPYEMWGRRVVYPKAAFREWCKNVTFINGIPRINLPVTAAPTLSPNVEVCKKQVAQ